MSAQGERYPQDDLTERARHQALIEESERLTAPGSTTLVDIPTVQRLLDHISALTAALRGRSEGEATTSQQWKVGNEFLPYHPQASHVSPDYRDGWNDCYRAALSARGKGS